jgi:alanyl-tRNA synthetase
MILPSSPVLPHEDPTLLFTNAGMNQFKEIFLGKNVRDYKRAATSQKCIRVGGKHNDLDNVGHTSRHLTFFEMLGNFSFGDYFKKEAITFAWEVATEVFQFPPEKIWPTIFQDDEEAFALWKQVVPEERITRFGEAENFWVMGEIGPCGPCSELLLDRGPKYGTSRSPKEDLSGERYLEFWNLVFMQFNRTSADRPMTPLPKKSIDTGAGLERVVALSMGVDSVFATDILRNLIAEIEAITERKYDPAQARSAAAYHVIADHFRSLAFAIADGAQPSNIDRGYVLRKLLRRAVRYGKSLGLEDPFLAKLLPRLIDSMGGDYPELDTASSRITEVISLEEENFFRTLKRGGNILNSIVEGASNSTHREISGADAFKLKDTYGLPIEEILLLAKDLACEVNLEQYQILEEMAREQSRKAHTTHAQVVEENLFQGFLEKYGNSSFIGYRTTSGRSTIVGILHDNRFVDSLQPEEEGWIFLESTPFYGEKGGQVGDTGTLQSGKALFDVKECREPVPGLIAHIGRLNGDSLRIGDTVDAEVEVDRRKMIAAHHTATHLLHWALQKVVGPHIRQAGSFVGPDRLRFDFNYHKNLTEKEVRTIEELINAQIRTNAAIVTDEIPYSEVQREKDVKQFFGEKYGTLVRLVNIHSPLGSSRELCGGTHAHHLGLLGLFRIVAVRSISAEVRRIEAVVGKRAEEYMYAQEELLDRCASLLGVQPNQTVEALRTAQKEAEQSNQKLKRFRKQAIEQTAESLQENIVIAEVALSADELNALAEELLQRGAAIVLLGAHQDGRALLLARIAPSALSKGVSAVALIKEIAPLINGKGGGKEASAQAGGQNPNGITKALDKARTLLSRS